MKVDIDHVIFSWHKFDSSWYIYVSILTQNSDLLHLVKS